MCVCVCVCMCSHNQRHLKTFALEESNHLSIMPSEKGTILFTLWGKKMAFMILHLKSVDITHAI